MSKIFDPTTEGLAKALDMRLIRHDLAAANIANADTPGYTAKKIDFEDSLSRAIQMEGLPEEGAIQKVEGDIYDNPEINVSNDKNTVDIEKEISTLTENSIIYKAAMELMRKKLAALKYSVTEGGR